MVHRVVVLALPQVVPFDLGIPARVFAETQTADGMPLYQVLTCSLGGLPVPTNAQFSISVEHDEQVLTTADTVVIATVEPSGELLAKGTLPSQIHDALSLIPAQARILSLCTSAFVLAAAGLLDGLTATTHWATADHFNRLFPQVRLDPGVLFTDNGKIVCSAGAAAGLDTCLHLVRRDHGAGVANAAARRIVMAPWREGGQAQFIDRPVPQQQDNSTTRTRQWALTRLDQNLSLADLSKHATMSVRTFSRRFRDETGLSPNQWLIQQRVDHARHLLEVSDLTIEHIAAQVGFGSATLLRKHLQTTIGVTPTGYRRTFQGPTTSIPQQLS
ncbi:GlxA family transcriptional regulator [Kineosporia babensis]